MARYLPYAQEKSRLEVMTDDDPMKQVAYQGDWGENLPNLYYLANRMVGQWQGDEGPAGKFLLPLETVAYPFVGLFDSAGTLFNTAANGYKRLYNNTAALYNNAAANVESWFTPTVTPQTSLTGRKITSNMAPATFQAPEVVATEVPQPEEYLWADGKIQARIAKPPVYKYSTGMPTVNRQGRRFNTFM